MDSNEQPLLENPCPRCGGEPVPIAYGLPGAEMLAAAERGEIRLGGCVVFDGQPTGQCAACGAAVGSRGGG